MSGLINRVLGTIERHRMFTAGQRAGVAVSGGADSVCLLHVLLELAPRWDLQLSVLHLDHQLRGEESRQDAEFVRGLAARLGLPFHFRQTPVAAAPGNLEQAARRARLAFFRETIESRAVDSIAVGHTRSDQAETVLFRFLRGSGSAGLAGIRPVTSGGIVRPLIGVDRAEVERFLRERAIAWREDSTNAGRRFARNRIRHELLPQLAREWNPGIAETLAHTADWAQAEEGYWEAEIARLAAEHLTQSRGAIILPAGTLMALPLAAARRLARHAIERVKGDLRQVDFAHISAVLRLAARKEGHGRILFRGVEVCRSFDWVRFALQDARRPADRNYAILLSVPGSARVPGTDLAISLELIEKTETSESADCVYNSVTGCLDWRTLPGSLEMRNWRPGDQYQPAGSDGLEKLKTLFQRGRIPIWERREWPVLVTGASIVWVRRFGPAAGFAASAGTRMILRVREIGSA